MKTVKNNRENCLRMIHNNYESDFENLLEMCGKPTMEIKSIKNKANLNPIFRNNMEVSPYENFFVDSFDCYD